MKGDIQSLLSDMEWKSQDLVEYREPVFHYTPNTHTQLDFVQYSVVGDEDVVLLV